MANTAGPKRAHTYAHAHVVHAYVRACVRVRRVRVYAGTNCDQINSYLYSSAHADTYVCASGLANMPIVTRCVFFVCVCVSVISTYSVKDRCIRSMR